MEAQREAEAVGLSAVDALQVAAARRAACDELVTAEKPEKPTKPLFRVASVKVDRGREQRSCRRQPAPRTA